MVEHGPNMEGLDFKFPSPKQPREIDFASKPENMRREALSKDMVSKMTTFELRGESNRIFSALDNMTDADVAQYKKEFGLHPDEDAEKLYKRIVLDKIEDADVLSALLRTFTSNILRAVRHS